MPKLGMPMSKSKDDPISLTLRSKVNVIMGAHCLMAIYPCAKYGKPMSKQKEVMGWTGICTDRVIPIYPLELC